MRRAGQAGTAASLSFIRPQCPAPPYPQWVQPPLYGLHRLQVLRRILQREHMRLALAESVLGRHGAAERHCLACELEHHVRGLLLLPGRAGEDIDVDMRIADVAEDDVLAGKLLFQTAAI